MTVDLFMGEPQDKQILFLQDRHRHVAFGGARGGGKSWAVRAKAKLLCLRYPGIKVLIVRRTYKELQNNHIDVLVTELHDVAKYNRSDKVFTFCNGSKLCFGYCATDSDVDQYQGAEYDVIFLDEATQLDEEWIKKITVCVRGTNGFPKRVYYTCNPGGRSHGYIKRLFVDRKYNSGENPDDYSFIKALVKDNKVLLKAQPEYLRQLDALAPKLRAAWRDGDWNIFEGQFFEEFVDDPKHYQDRLNTHVIDPFNPPMGWTICRSFDFGYSKPFSCGWWAIDYDGIIYRILEYYGCQRDENGQAVPNEGLKSDPDRMFAEIARIEREHPYLKGRDITGVADPSIWDSSRGESVAEMAMKHGVFFSPGDNHRLTGWMQCHYRLAFDEEGRPRMYVFNTCDAFIRTIPLLIYDDKKVEDLDTSQEDHVADEWRYLCMSRPIKPIPAKEPDPDYSDPLNQMSGIRWRQR